MSLDADFLVPVPASWFVSCLQYGGHGGAEFSEAKGSAEGWATATIITGPTWYTPDTRRLTSGAASPKSYNKEERRWSVAVNSLREGVQGRILFSQSKSQKCRFVRCPCANTLCLLWCFWSPFPWLLRRSLNFPIQFCVESKLYLLRVITSLQMFFVETGIVGLVSLWLIRLRMPMQFLMLMRSS